MLPAACENEFRAVTSSEALSGLCPAPTPPARLATILQYLETAPPSDGLDVLATEWERLDDGARKAR